MLSKSKREMLAHYNRGLALYKKRHFKEALLHFQKALEFEPMDGPTRKYINRCKGYSKNPPPPDWDGVYTMETK